MLGNWIKQTTTTAGTGNLTLASVTGFDTFNSQFSNGATGLLFKYVVSDGNNWETGTGHMSSSTVLVRDIPEMSLSAGVLTRYGSALSLSGGTVTVFCDLTSENKETPYVFSAQTNGIPFRRNGTQTMNCQLFANWIFSWPVYLEFGGIFSGIRHHCIIAGGGTKFQWGIYQQSITGYPGVLIARTADIVPGTGDVTTSFTANAYIERGWYALAWSGDGGPAFNASVDYGGSYYGPFGVDATGQASHLQLNLLESPLPAVYPASSVRAFTAPTSCVSRIELIQV